MHVVAHRAIWWSRFASQRATTLKLVCFPFAGGAASVFRRWPLALPRQVEVVAIRLPGRGERINEPPISEWPVILPPLASELATILDTPFVFFGHSLGALLAYEVARWLRRHRTLAPRQLLVSGCRAPHLPSQEPSACLDPGTLRARLRTLQGTPPEILASDELFAVLEPCLRADFLLAEGYHYEREPPFSCPLIALGGADDQETQDGKLEAWRQHTTGPFTARVFPGHHFYLLAQERALLTLIAHELASIA